MFLAAERTALAWNRSALALMAFGFVVERAGFLGEALSANVPAGASWPAAVLGIVAMLMAASVAGLSAWRGRLILEALIRHAPPEAVPPRRVALLGWATMALGLWLSVWLTIETAMRVGSLKGLA
ncbi:MAG: YidH family protein [Thioalkalivibrionaceae bacterium]